jgi:hypothetical protein
VRPISHSSSILFSTPAILSYMMSGIGAIFFIASQIKLGSDIFSPYPLSAILR